MSAPQPKPPTTAQNLDATVVPDAATPPPSGNSTGPGPNRTAVQNLDATRAEAPQTSGKAPAHPPAQKPASGGEKKATQLGDFRLMKKLGQGGMGEVFLAHQVSLDRQVALKVMNKQFSKQENFVKRFKREAQTMAKLNHPNIVQGYAVGEEQGLLYLAMELVKGHEKGRSLQDWMNNQQKLEIGDALHVTLIIADALKYANEMSLIHRDIKPDNMLITEKGVVKLSDMGLAKATDEDMSMTQSGTGLGTPYYMPPEQATDAKHVDHRSDIYALGCTCYYFLTGELPFKGTSAMELIMSKTKGTFTRARSLNKEIPERLDLIIDKMIAKDPKTRYQTYEELIRDLQSVGRANTVLSFIASSGVAAAPPSATVLAGSSVGNPAAAGRPATSVPGAKAPVASAAAAQTQGDAVWQVIQSQANGPPKKAKFTTTQIRQLLKAGTLDAKVKACPANSTDYRPLASYPEFEQILKAKVVQASASKKTQEFDKLYQQIDRAQRWRPYIKWFRGFFDGVKGLISLVIYLAVLIGIGVGAYIYWPVIWGAIQSRTGGAPAPAAVAPAQPVAPATTQ
ncbi:MAG: protein kinase [Planctomycetota bacterium]